MESQGAPGEEVKYSQWKHIQVTSKKYGNKYELIWSDKFIEGMHNINNRSITNMITKIKKDTEGLRAGLKFTQPSFVVRDAVKGMSKEDLQNESIQARNNLLDWIAENNIVNSFESQLQLCNGKFWTFS